MTFFDITAAVVAVTWSACTVLAAHTWWRRRAPSDWLGAAERRRLIVHTTDDRSIEGLVASAAVDGLVLSAARLLEKTPVDLAGDVWVPKAKIVFVQAPPPAP